MSSDLDMMIAQMVAGALVWGAAAARYEPRPVPPPVLPGARIVPFVPGRFAGALKHHSMNSCSQSYQTIDSSASVTLDLAADGTASGCGSRSYWSSIHSNPLLHGKQARSGENDIILDDQHGMRGRWRRDGDAVVVDLDPDRTVCPARPKGDKPAPWRLRCVAVAPDGSSSRLKSPALACKGVDRPNVALTAAEVWALPGYTTRSVIAGEWWMFLGRGPGLALDEHSVGVGLNPKIEVDWKSGVAP